MTWLVVGLGNPGERYAKTRHNLGRRVVETLAARHGARFRRARFLPLDTAEFTHAGERVVLVRPRTYMNESGPPIASYASRHRTAPERIVAVHDEIDLGFGALKVKRGGSTAGHNGLNSMVSALRTPDFHRVRLGVGRPTGRQDPADYVLDAFAKREREDADVLVEEAADAVLSLVADGLEATANRFNRNAVK